VKRRAVEEERNYEEWREELIEHANLHERFINNRVPDEFRKNIIIRYYDAPPVFSMFKNNDTMVVGFYLFGQEGVFSPHIEFELKEGGLYSYFEKHFDAVWENSQDKTAIPSEAVIHHTTTELFNRFFSGQVFNHFFQARKQSQETNVPVFLVVFDQDNPKKSRIDYYLRWFMEYDSTKQLVEENFIQVLASSTDEGVSEYIPLDDPLEHCLLLVLTPNGEIIRRKGVPGNPDDALNFVRECISLWATAKDV
jgi:hypothetical protein